MGSEMCIRDRLEVVRHLPGLEVVRHLPGLEVVRHLFAEGWKLLDTFFRGLEVVRHLIELEVVRHFFQREEVRHLGNIAK